MDGCILSSSVRNEAGIHSAPMPLQISMASCTGIVMNLSRPFRSSSSASFLASIMSRSVYLGILLSASLRLASAFTSLCLVLFVIDRISVRHSRGVSSLAA